MCQGGGPINQYLSGIRDGDICRCAAQKALNRNSSRITTDFIVVVALGPVLGSMDSHQVETDLKCTEKGLALTVMLTRSADYDGAHLKNVLWRPKIQLTMVLHQPEATLETMWNMRLTTGAQVHHAQFPPYSDQIFPIILSKTLR